MAGGRRGARHRADDRPGLRSPAARRRLPLVLAGAAALIALTAFAALPGGGSLALWNGAAASNGGTVTGGTVSLTETMGPTLAFTFRSGQTTTTGGVVVTNTGTVTSSLSSVVTLGSGSSSALARAIGITVWPVASVASCTAAATAPSGAYTSTWASAAGIPLTGTIAPGATSAYCIRSAMNVASASGIADGSAVALTITSVVTAGTWTSSASVSSTQSFTDDIAPATPTLSLTASTATSATLAFLSTDNVGVTSYRIARDGVAVATVAAPATTATLPLPPGDHTLTVTASDAAGNVSAASTPVTVSAPIVSTTWYQVVSAATGLCAAVPATGLGSGTAVSQAACVATTAAGGQAWTLPAANATGAVTSARPSPTSPLYYWSAAGSPPNAQVQLGTNAGQTRAQWTTTALANGLFRFAVTPSANGTTVCLDAGTGGQLRATTCSATAASQQFSLVAVTP